MILELIVRVDPSDEMEANCDISELCTVTTELEVTDSLDNATEMFVSVVSGNPFVLSA